MALYIQDLAYHSANLCQLYNTNIYSIIDIRHCQIAMEILQLTLSILIKNCTTTHFYISLLNWCFEQTSLTPSFWCCWSKHVFQDHLSKEMSSVQCVKNNICNVWLSFMRKCWDEEENWCSDVWSETTKQVYKRRMHMIILCIQHMNGETSLLFSRNCIHFK